MKLQKFESFLFERKEEIISEISGGHITVEGKRIKLTWVVTHYGNVHAKGAHWEAMIKDKNSLKELRNIGLEFEEPHTWLFDTIVRNIPPMLAVTLNPKFVELDPASGVEGDLTPGSSFTKEEFVDLSQYHHGMSTFELK